MKIQDMHKAIIVKALQEYGENHCAGAGTEYEDAIYALELAEEIAEG